MLSPTEGYLSPCPTPSALCSLLLPPSNKESLGQITPLHVVIFGAYISLQFLSSYLILVFLALKWEYDLLFRVYILNSIEEINKHPFIC
jgi:hypothetical protein